MRRQTALAVSSTCHPVSPRHRRQCRWLLWWWANGGWRQQFCGRFNHSSNADKQPHTAQVPGSARCSGWSPSSAPRCANIRLHQSRRALKCFLSQSSCCLTRGSNQHTLTATGPRCVRRDTTVAATVHLPDPLGAFMPLYLRLIASLFFIDNGAELDGTHHLSQPHRSCGRLVLICPPTFFSRDMLCSCAPSHRFSRRWLTLLKRAVDPTQPLA